MSMCCAPLWIFALFLRMWGLLCQMILLVLAASQVVAGLHGAVALLVVAAEGCLHHLRAGVLDAASVGLICHLCVLLSFLIKDIRKTVRLQKKE